MKEKTISPTELQDLARCRCWAEIDLSAFKRNIHRMRKLVGSDVRILIPVKSDAYGHGALDIARSAIDEGVSCFGVSSLDEAIGLRDGGVDAMILLLTPPLPEQLPMMLRFDITPVISDVNTANRFGELALGHGKVAAVHIEVDTGMGRTGIPWNQAGREFPKFTALEGIRIEGIMTHFASADDRNPDFTLLQLERFQNVLSQVPSDLYDEIIFHASNSAASMRFPAARFSMIRPGLSLYGVSPLEWSEEISDEFEPVLCMKSRVVLVKEVSRGDPISYGGKWIAPGARKIATISAGYRDGISYKYSGGGKVLIRGKSFFVVGAVCMDMMMVDLVNDQEVTEGDVVTVLGEDGETRIRARDIADITSTVPYDVLCSAGMRVPRVYYDEGKIVGVKSVIGTERLEMCRYSSEERTNE